MGAGAGGIFGGGMITNPAPAGGPLTPRPNPYAGQIVPMPMPGGPGKGGGQPAPPAPMPAPAPAPAAAPAAPAPAAPAAPAVPAFNVNQAAASALQQALGGTQRAIGNTGMFTNYVTDRTLADLERQRQMQQNEIGAQADRANAYGGSRHGIAEAMTNEAFARQGADAFGKLQLGQQQAQMRGAAQLGQLGQQAFNTGRAINQDLMAQGLLQQSLQQALLDSAAGDFQNYANAPMNSLSAPLAALGAANMGQQTQTKTENPGLLGTLGALKYVGLF